MLKRHQYLTEYLLNSKEPIEILGAFFFYFYLKIYVVSTHIKCLIEKLPMSIKTNFLCIDKKNIIILKLEKMI